MRRGSLSSIARVLSAALAVAAICAPAHPEPTLESFGAGSGGASPFAARPDDQQAGRLTPPELIALRQMGQVELRCRVAREGRLTGCIVDHEIPHHIGLGDAALKAMAFVRLRAVLADGTKTEGQYAALSLIFAVGGNESGPHPIYPHLSVLSRQLGPPLGHPLEMADGTQRVDDDLLRRAIPPRPPQVTYDPRLADVGACQWRELGEATQQSLVSLSDQAPPFTVVMAMQFNGKLPSFEQTKVCDPGFWTHTGASYVARLAGVIQGLSLARLEPSHVSKAQLEAVWRSNATLRETTTTLYKGAGLQEAEASAMGATLRPMFQKAWAELGQSPSPALTAASPEMAASSYWMARAWETVIVEPLTVRSLQDGGVRSADRQ